MIRKIIRIDTEKCNGCALCVNACSEGAIAIVDGKAALIRDDYCDGLGTCLPTCPAGAIGFEEREAAAYDGEAHAAAAGQLPCGCPGANARALNHAPPGRCCAPVQSSAPEQCYAPGQCCASVRSELRQWPVQIKLAPVNAPYFNGARLLVAADCAAYAYGDFHSRYMKDRITLIGCPKLDNTDYSEKLADIMANNNIKSVTIARMEVPCCYGIEDAVISAMHKSGKFVPWQVVTLTIDGESVEA